jgi:hypothetical protein
MMVVSGKAVNAVMAVVGEAGLEKVDQWSLILLMLGGHLNKGLIH